MKFEAIIGLEIHAKLNTKSKLFSHASSTFGADPNIQANLIDLAMPGTLPAFLNEEALRMACMFGLSIGAKINKKSIFVRKHYFYPDNPKGYQISQYHSPIISNGGHIDICLENNVIKPIGIHHAHLEEDAGKSFHNTFTNMSGIDLNRSGIPLLEIVSEPTINNAKEAISYVKAIHNLLKYLGICNGNMYEGELRCDCNISIRKQGNIPLGPKTEIKNLNSFKFIEQAINYEIQRQTKLIEINKKITQETLLYDQKQDKTISIRKKEIASDYRYFNCPDLLPVIISSDFINQVRATLPELPNQKKTRFIKKYSLSDDYAKLLSNDYDMADFFEKLTAVCLDAKLAAHWIIVELKSFLNKKNIEIKNSPISYHEIGEIIIQLKKQTISKKIAKKIFLSVANCEGKVTTVMKCKNMQQINDPNTIISIIQKIVSTNTKKIEEYNDKNNDKNKCNKIFNFLFGKIISESEGKANPKIVHEYLKKQLNDKL